LLAKKFENDRDEKLFAGSRTLRAELDLSRLLDELKVESAETVAHFVCESFLSKKATGEAEEEEPEGTEDATKEAEPAETSTLLYFSPGELKAIAQAVAKLEPSVRRKALQNPPQGDRKAEKEIKKTRKSLNAAASLAAKNFTRKDAADIAIFGRMVANDPTLNVEAAGLFSHAISTHACDNDLDFWTAVDDNKGPEEEAGAANMGHAEFNAACYYRYVALNLDLLFYQKDDGGKPSANLCALLKPEHMKLRQEIVRAFLRAVILAVPTAKHTGMNANLPPEYVLGLFAAGQPMQLVNAFEAPVRANGQGWLKPSVDVLEKHFDRFKNLFDLKPLISEEVRLSEQTPLNQFIEKLVTHVE